MTLLYRAGSRALGRLRAEGLGPGTVSAFVGPATGPRWLGFAELDFALHDSGLLCADGQGRRVLLVGASAGAWRMAALCAPDPRATLKSLSEHYIGQTFHGSPTPSDVSAAYRGLLEEVYPDDAAAHMLTHPERHLGILATRAIQGWPERRSGQFLVMARALAAHAFRPSALTERFRRTLLCAHPGTWPRLDDADVAPLTPRNVREALLASGSVPGYLDPVRIADAPAGDYVDGGVTDYHLGHRVTDRPIILVAHHDARITAAWFDKHLPWRRTPAELLDDVLLMYPSREYIAALPGGELPDRRDFHRFAQAPVERMTRWREAMARSEALAQQFVDDLTSGRLVERAAPMTA
jgi:predicted acylesterase/phospholipase RssA